MSIWLGLDVETTGLSNEEHVVTEVGAVLWDTKTKAPLLFFNALINIGQEVPPMITRLTGITTDMLDTYGMEEASATRGLLQLMLFADFMVAHNAPFDRGFIGKMFQRNALAMPSATWIDSSKDVPYPEEITTRKLVHLAAEHGFANPFAHRAVTDVLTMLQILSNYDPDMIEQSAGQPNMVIRALVKFDEKEKAKEQGFRWDGKTKIWTREIKMGQLESIRQKCEASDFLIEVIS